MIWSHGRPMNSHGGVWSAGSLRGPPIEAAMLIELFGKNFGCFRDEFRLSMLATDIDRQTDRGIVRITVEGDDTPLELLRCIGVFGPNASGKSTVLRAASSLRYLISSTRRMRSDQALGPYEPFALAGTTVAPVMIGVTAILHSRVYEYRIEFDRRQFIHERLTHLAIDRDHVLFDRHGQDVVGQWLDDEQFNLISQDFRPNALLLSLADRLAPSLAKGIAVGLRQLLVSSDPTSFDWSYDRAERAAKRVRDDSRFSKWLLSQLKAADIGVIDLRAEEMRVVTEITPKPSVNDTNAPEPEVDISYRLALLHVGEQGPVPLSYFRESAGTRRLVELAPLLYDLARTESPRAAFVDELDASMHPVLLQRLVHHFNCNAQSNARSQLIFACHEIGLLDDEAKHNVLRRDQVYFTDKDALGAARLRSLAEFKERNNLNLRRRYLQGRYGALPALGDFLG